MKVYKPVDLPYSARETMKFSEEDTEKIDSIIFNATITGAWETPQNIAFDVHDLNFWAYAIYKTEHPIVKPMVQTDIEQLLAPFKQSLFSFNHEGFQLETIKTLSAVGDLMCTKGLENSKDKLYESVEVDLFQSDVIYANLESTLTQGEIKSIEINSGDTPSISSNIEQYQTMTAHKSRTIDIVQLANNHILDCGEEGITTTVDQLKSDHIYCTGVNETELEAFAPRIQEISGLRIGWVAHTSDVNLKPIPDDKPWIVNITPFHIEKNPDLTSICEQIKKCRANKCDLVIVTLHWGLEYEFYPHPDQIGWAKTIAEAGADIILGHHPHVIQPVQIINPSFDASKSVPVIYSLGNLTPILSNPATVLSLIAKFKIGIGFLNNQKQVKVTSLELKPVALVNEVDKEENVLKLIPVNDLLTINLDEYMEAYVTQIANYADLVLGSNWRLSDEN
ncbi:MAG: CapA family protein [Eubacteriales bacterium]|nr:CapA family protein [Eubacteriales bacterium]